MNKTMDSDFAIIALMEILFDQQLINKETLDAIKEKVRIEKSHISQGSEKSI